MTKLIAKRYEIINETTSNSEGFRRALGQDHQSADEPLVQIKLFPRPKHPDLIHSIFESRAKEVCKIGHSGLAPLLDYGYDGSSATYYLSYENVPGKQLASYLKTAPASFDWCLDVLLEICDTLNYLHSRGMTYGILDATNILLQLSGQLPLRLIEPGLSGIEVLLQGNTSVQVEDPIRGDLICLGKVAVQLLTRLINPTAEQIKEAVASLPSPMRDFLNRSLGVKDTMAYQSVAEAIRDLLYARSQNDAKTVYYLEVTRKASERLQEMGFIADPEAYLSVKLLNDELRGEVYGRAIDNAERGTFYYITTPRFRLRCAPAQSAPDRHLVIMSVECPSPTGIVAEREQGLTITASLTVVFSGQTPEGALITPLLDKLNEHRLEVQQRKRTEIAQKNSLDIWNRVLALQRRILNEFELAYTSWELTDGGSSILIDLTEDCDRLDLSGDERMCMSASNGRWSIFAGFFEELVGNRLKIGLAKGADADAFAKQGKVTLDNAQIRSILRRQEDAFRRLKFGESANPALYRLLTDPSGLEVDRIANRQFWDQTLDPPQQDVVRKAMAAKDIFLVHGPPGTGKTTTIVELVRQILHSDQHAPRVLIASQSNVAVNHALLSLLKAEPGLCDTVVRIGREEKAGATTEFLLDQQLTRWTAQVADRSQAYMETTRRKLSIDSGVVECVSLLEEYETKQIRRQQKRQEGEVAQKEYTQVSQQVHKLNTLLAELQNLKQRVTVLTSETAPNDGAFTQLLTAFETDYLNWGHQFLQQASEAVRLSQRRAELLDAMESLEKAESELTDQMAAATISVREILRRMYGHDLADPTVQRAYIEQHLSKQQAMALKLGRLQKVAHDWTRRVKGDTSDFASAYLGRSQVIGATCIGIAAKGDASEVDFDWVIVDEAGRATHPELIVPLVRGRKLVLVGDHRQLPPIVDRDLTNELLEDVEISRSDLETSLFQDLIGRAPSEATGKLLVQYRMHPAIGNLISKCFYKDELVNGVEADDRRHGLAWMPTSVTWYSTHRLKHHEEHREGTSYQNIAEMEAILRLLDRIERELATQNLRKQVGVITGYMAQKQLLRQRIPQAAGQSWPHIMLEIDTVDAYQGREMDYIIYSIVRSNPEHKIGFLRDDRRLNVALSRARELLVVVGDRETSEAARTGGQMNPFFEVLQHIRSRRGECLLEDLMQ